MKNIAVFCSSSELIPEVYKSKTEELGAILAKNNYNLIYGGGRVGLMGIIAKQFKKYNAKRIGVIPENPIIEEIRSIDDTEQIITKTMQERKLIMSERSDAFVILPGGFGTLDELFEVLTLKQINVISNKPIILVNWQGFFNPIIEQLKMLVEQKFTEYKTDCLTIIDDNSEILKYLKN